MKIARVLIASFAGPVLAVGCAASPPPKPAVDIAAEKAAVEHVLQDQLTGAKLSGEAGAEAYAATGTDDLVVLPPNAARVDGRKAVRDWTLQFTSATDWSPSWKADQIEVAASGDLAYAVGHYELSLKDAKGNAVSDRGKFLDTLKKQADGKWKLTVIAFSSDLPIPGAPAPK